METVFQKSQKGSEEVATRVHGLSARLRRCLILIDGKRSLADLKTVLSSDNVDQMLVELIEAGLIEGNIPIAVLQPEPAPTPTLSPLREPAADASPATEFDSPATLTPAAPALRRASE